MAETEDGEGDEDETFDEDGSESNAVGDRTGSMVTDDGVGEIGIELRESACITFPVGEGGMLTPMPGANAIGMLAKRPMQKLHRAEIAAVAVTKSRLTSCTHSKYSVLVSHKSAMLSAGHSQVPPVSEIMVELTEMM